MVMNGWPSSVQLRVANQKVFPVDQRLASAGAAASAIMEVVNPADAQSATKADRRNQQYRELQLQSPPKKEDVPKELRAPRSSVNDLRNWLFSAANAPMTSEILCSWPIGRSFSIFTRRFLTSSRGAYAAVRLSKRRDHKRRIL